MKVNKTDRLFKDKIGGLEYPPSSEPWQVIEQTLQKKKNQQRWRWLAAAASIILLVGLGSYFVINDSMNLIQTAVDTSTQLKNTEPEMTTNKKTMKGEDTKTESEHAGKMAMKMAQNKNQEINNIKPDTKHTTNKKQHRAENTIAMKTPNTTEVNANISSVELQDQPRPIAQKLAQLPDEISKTDEIPLAVDQGTELPTTQKNAPDVASQAAIKQNNLEEQKYPQVKIIYKKSQDESVLAYAQEKIVEKSIKKISDIKDDLKISDETKAKIRNAKDDILTLNFGRIFGKTTQNIKN